MTTPSVTTQPCERCERCELIAEGFKEVHRASMEMAASIAAINYLLWEKNLLLPGEFESTKIRMLAELDQLVEARDRVKNAKQE